MKAVERWYTEMPREEEMLPKDKYTLFDKKEKSYRKSIHSMKALSHQNLGHRECLLDYANPYSFNLLQSCRSGPVSANV